MIYAELTTLAAVQQATGSTVSTGAAFTNVDHTVPTGKKWIIIAAYGQHNENAARGCTWWLNTYILGSTNRGLNEQHHLKSWSGTHTDPPYFPNFPVLSAAQILRFSVSTLTSGNIASTSIYYIEVDVT